MKKKILAMCLVVALLATAIVGATLAYFVDEDEATNTFTVGNVDIDLIEPSWDSSGSQDAPEVYPGEALKKDPQVINIGANPCFVRISVEGLDCLGSAGMIKYRTGGVVDALGTDWVKYGDYYYYCKVLPNSVATTPLFDSIVIPTDLENGDGTTEFDIDITAYAVQAQGAKPSFSAVETMTVEEIAAWFATCGL